MKWPSTRRILHVVGVVILIASVVPFVLYAVPEAGGADHGFVVTSESMSPAIPLGSIVLVDEKGTEAYEHGDVITFETEGDPAPTTHRIQDVRQTDDGQVFVTKGDANDDPDSSPVDPEQVIGNVVLTIPYAGHVILFVNSRFGFFAFIALPLFLLVVDTAWQIVSAPGDSEGSTTATGAESSSKTAEEFEFTGETSEQSDSESSGSVTVTTTDLRMTVVVLVLFASYGAWTITRGLNPVKMAVTVATGSAALIVLGLIVRSRFGAGVTESEPDPERADFVPAGKTDRLPEVPATAVESPADDGGISNDQGLNLLTSTNEVEGGENVFTDGGPDETDTNTATGELRPIPGGAGTRPYRRINDHDE